jgi:hypothetical protein
MDFSYEEALDVFNKCLKAKYIHIEENSVDYCVEFIDDTAYIYFQWSNGKVDWKNNFDFPATPYSDMKIKWRCHRGFLRVWKTIKPCIEQIDFTKAKKIVVVGYSHGAAIATLCHEYIWFNYPDKRDCLIGYGFGCPRCYFGFKVKKSLKERWKTFYPVRNLNDIVTHVPPRIFGFIHTNKVIKIGEKGVLNNHDNPTCIAAHYDDNYRLSLKNCIKQEEKNDTSNK